MTKEQIKAYIAALCAPVTLAEACEAFGKIVLLQPALTCEDMTNEKRAAVIREFFEAVRGIPATAHVAECARALEAYNRDRMARIRFKRIYDAAAQLAADHGPELKAFVSRAECEAWIREHGLYAFAREVFRIPEGDRWIAISFGRDAYNPDTYALLDEHRMVLWDPAQ